MTIWNERFLSCQLVTSSQVSAYGGFGFDSGWVGPPNGPQYRYVVDDECDYALECNCPIQIDSSSQSSISSDSSDSSLSSVSSQSYSSQSFSSQSYSSQSFSSQSYSSQSESSQSLSSQSLSSQSLSSVSSPSSSSKSSNSSSSKSSSSSEPVLFCCPPSGYAGKSMSGTIVSTSYSGGSYVEKYEYTYPSASYVPSSGYFEWNYPANPATRVTKIDYPSSPEPACFADDATTVVETLNDLVSQQRILCDESGQFYYLEGTLDLYNRSLLPNAGYVIGCNPEENTIMTASCTYSSTCNSVSIHYQWCYWGYYGENCTDPDVLVGWGDTTYSFTIA